MWFYYVFILYVYYVILLCPFHILLCLLRVILRFYFMFSLCLLFYVFALVVLFTWIKKIQVSKTPTSPLKENQIYPKPQRHTRPICSRPNQLCADIATSPCSTCALSLLLSPFHLQEIHVLSPFPQVACKSRTILPPTCFYSFQQLCHTSHPTLLVTMLWCLTLLPPKAFVSVKSHRGLA